MHGSPLHSGQYDIVGTVSCYLSYVYETVNKSDYCQVINVSHINTATKASTFVPPVFSSGKTDERKFLVV